MSYLCLLVIQKNAHAHPYTGWQTPLLLCEMQLCSCFSHALFHFLELQWSDRHRIADSPARQEHHLCKSPQEWHHRPGVPGNNV